MPLDRQRHKLWLQLAALIVVIAFVLVRPRIAAWLESRQGATSPESGRSVPAELPGDVPAPKDNVGERSTVVNWKRGDDASVDPEIATRRDPAESDDLLNKERAHPGVTAAAGAETGRGAKTASTSSDRPSASTRPRGRDTQAGKATEQGDRTLATPLGQLNEIRANVFESTAGLVYRSGSEDGHRLEHVLQHAADNPDKPKHGVFEGDRETILALIDEAYQMSQKGGSDVRSQDQNDRTVITVNLRRRIGYAGGEEGERLGHPACHYLRLVLENDVNVITAYPTRSF